MNKTLAQRHFQNLHRNPGSAVIHFPSAQQRAILNGPRREKTCLRGIPQREFQTSLLIYRDTLEN